MPRSRLTFNYFYDNRIKEIGENWKSISFDWCKFGTLNKGVNSVHPMNLTLLTTNLDLNLTGFSQISFKSKALGGGSNTKDITLKHFFSRSGSLTVKLERTYFITF